MTELILFGYVMPCLINCLFIKNYVVRNDEPVGLEHFIIAACPLLNFVTSALFIYASIFKILNKR